MKATIDIPDELYREVKIAAAVRGTKVKDLVAEGLRLVLRGKPMETRRRRIRLPIVKSGVPGTLKVPDDAASELDAMEDRSRHAASMR